MKIDNEKDLVEDATEIVTYRLESIGKSAKTVALNQMVGNLPEVDFEDLMPGYYWLRMETENLPCLALIKDLGRESRNFWAVSTLGIGEKDWLLHNFDLCEWWGPLILHEPIEWSLQGKE